MCKAYDIEISEADCDMLCVSINVNDDCAIYDCCGERSSGTCEIAIVIDDGETEHDTILQEITSVTYCIPRNESGEYEIIVYAADCNSMIIFNDTTEFIIPGCDDITISSDITWTSANVPNEGRFQEVLIEAGATLTVAADVTLSFCPDGVLIIEPNAELMLYGTLTSACNDGWNGVKVYGNSTFSQYYDYTAGVYHHGSLRGYPGSHIENAWTAVELYGPDADDTGGRIRCDSTTFLNNRFGIKFGPYTNFAVTGDPRDYRASFRNCTFSINDVYILDSKFVMHMRLNRVNGVLIHGTDFWNLRNLTEQYAYFDYGYGIYAINSGFTVSAITAGASPPYDRSTFTGLGVGVRVLPFLENKFFKVSQSDFTDCYNGIIVDGVSVGTMHFNHFNMGELPDPDVLNWELYEGGQVGIIVRRGISGFVLEENEFEASNGNADHTIGIVADNLGAADNLIRRNTFDGLTISNEAFGINGFSHLPIPIGGLKYFCNANSATLNKDFYVTDEEVSGYVVNNIHSYQGLLIPLQGNYATGNVFASTGNQTDGDFANYGTSGVDYWYDDGDPDQEPDARAGIDNIFPGPPNDCEELYCIPPCITDLGEDKEEYLTAVPLYYDAVNNEEWDTAAAYKFIMDRAAMRVIQHYLQDTLTFNNDSLLLWYHYLLTPVGEILRSKYFASKGDFTTAGQLLAAIPNFYDLSQYEEDDLDYIQDIYDILDARSIDNLTSADLEDLEEISTYPGHSAALARGILSYYDYGFGPEYYLPDEEEPYIQAPNTEHPTISGTEGTVFPNPSNGDEIIVHVPAYSSEDTPLILKISDMMGREIGNSNLIVGSNTIKLVLLDGVYIYLIKQGETRLKSGVLVISESMKK
ncbi:MAG TPA: T9SS type A sorting domain-containing protein [Saprospiraceae bacterium]|nr:T9SS type A sorting domain-containing protein [Saprospiraceae bacterium]